MVKQQPIDKVEWVEPGTLHANDYNPNKVAPVELRLLKQSILEDGWTQPIVARANNEIVDGFHRWTLASKDSDIADMTGGLVPVVRLSEDASRADQQMSTIRHNRARGTHYVLQMANIVHELLDSGIERAALGKRLGMDPEEVDRLYDYGQMTKRGKADSFGPAWRPGYSHEVEKEGE